MTASDVKNLRMQIGDLNIYSSGDTKHEARGASKVLFHKGFSMKHLVTFLKPCHIKFKGHLKVKHVLKIIISSAKRYRTYSLK